MNRQQAAAELMRRRRERAENQTLSGFARNAWHVLEPATPLKWGWALDAICDHLTAVTDGHITRLCMNVPPGTMKSLLTGVIWPAWEWGPRDNQEMRFLGTSHKEALATRDNLKCRRLITSEWYQSRWSVNMLSDQNMKTKFENDRTGFREAMAFGSMTGSRGDRVSLDDPLSADDANSDAELLAAETTFLEALPTRVNNESSAIVVIMQRLHERDTTGVIYGRDLPYTHLVLPMEFEEERRCYSVVRPTWHQEPPIMARLDRKTQHWYTTDEEIPEDREEVLEEPLREVYCQDLRETDGDLLFPERFPQSQVEELKKTLGSYASAGQLQQRPTPRGGGMFRREWFQPIAALPSRVRMARGWDFAAAMDETEAATASVLMARTIEDIPRYIIVDVTRDHLSAAGVERRLRTVAADDEIRYGKSLRGSFPQDPGQAGKAQKLRLLTGPLAGRNYHGTPETGDKATRALPLSAAAEAGTVYYLVANWNAAFLDEISAFPTAKFKDQVDAASRAFAELTVQPTWYSPETIHEAYGT